MKSHADVVIVGGGPVGLALAGALAVQTPLDIVVLEARADSSVGATLNSRVLALSHGTRLMFERLGVWSAALEATPIESIHVSQRGGFGRTLIHAREQHVPALGYTIEYGQLIKSQRYSLRNTQVEYIDQARVQTVSATSLHASAVVERAGEEQTISARLLVLADGGQQLAESLRAGSNTRTAAREKDYGQSALIARVKSELAHEFRAYERFTPAGPAALLPIGDRFALVWTAAPEQAARLLALEQRVFLEELHAHFGDRVGRFVEVGPRLAFPLKLRYFPTTAAERVITIGNAAQALHPVAGQGLNMGLRDAWTLARIAAGAPREALGGEAMLARYRRERRVDRISGIGLTDFLVRGFSNDSPLLKLARGLGLSALDAAPPLRRWFARKMMYGAMPGMSE